MSTNLAHIGTGTATQAAATATANGTAVDVTGALRTLVRLSNHTASLFTAGAVAIETSTDGGTNWASAANVLAFGTADGGSAISQPITLPTAFPQDVWYTLPHLDGPAQVRTRISTTITGSSLDAFVYPIGL